MRVSATDTIAGIPVLRLRKMFRHASGYMWDATYIARQLSLSEAKAADVITTLVHEGYIEALPREDRDEEERWELTEKGQAFTTVRATKPIRRATAERLLRELLERVEAVNQNPQFLLSVRKVVLFGSMLSDAETVSDIDLAYALERREHDRKKYRKLVEQHVARESANGRVFGSQLAMLLWPEREVELFLRNNSRSLSFHSMDDPILEVANTRIIYELPMQELRER